MVNSKQKGNRGELELVHELVALGYTARRGQQYRGAPDSPDVVCDELSLVHWEVKRTERLDLAGAMAQAIMDVEDTDRIPVVASKKNRGPWLVTLRLDDFLGVVDSRQAQDPSAAALNVKEHEECE